MYILIYKMSILYIIYRLLPLKIKVKKTNHNFAFYNLYNYFCNGFDDVLSCNVICVFLNKKLMLGNLKASFHSSRLIVFCKNNA